MSKKDNEYVGILEEIYIDIQEYISPYEEDVLAIFRDAITRAGYGDEMEDYPIFRSIETPDADEEFEG